jgi:hypothetical protein
VTSAIFTRRAPHSAQKPYGRIEEIYVAEETAAPDWALVRSDSPANASSFLPLHGSRSDGDEVIVPFTKTEVTDAPWTREASRLSPEQGAALYDHYGIRDAGLSSTEARLDGAGQLIDVAGEPGQPNIPRVAALAVRRARPPRDRCRCLSSQEGPGPHERQ